MAKRHPIRLGIEAALVCVLIGVLGSRWFFAEEEAPFPTDDVARESRMEVFAKKRSQAARKAAQQRSLSGLELTEEDFELVPTDFEETEPVGDGVLLLQVVDEAGKEIVGPYLLVCPEAAYTNTVSAATLRLDLQPGYYRFGAVQEAHGVVLEAPDRMVQVSAGKVVSLTLRMAAAAQEDAGIGATLRKVGDWFEVVSVEEGGGAHRSGLKVGDVVIEIQGVSTDEMASESEAAAWLRGPVDKAVSVVRALPDGEGFRADEMAIPRSADP